MTIRVAMLALVCVAGSGLAIAQTQTPPADTPSPSTSNPPPAKEAPTTESNRSRPSSASSPHQRQATGKESMKECIARERAADSAVSEKDAKKTCKEQTKPSSESSNR